MSAYTAENLPSDLNIMNNLRNSDLLIMEQQGFEGLLPTHLKFVNYVNANIDKMYYNLGDNAISYTSDSAGVSLDDFWGLEDQNRWRWTRGKECSVHLYGNKLAESDEYLNIHLNASSYGLDRSVEVKFNGTPLETIKLLQKEQGYIIPVPTDLVNEKENIIEFHLHGDTFSPKDLEKSDDTRNLGIGIANLSIEGGNTR